MSATLVQSITLWNIHVPQNPHTTVNLQVTQGRIYEGKLIVLFSFFIYYSGVSLSLSLISLTTHDPVLGTVPTARNILLDVHQITWSLRG
jgi:hypothetical protein